MLLVRLRGQAGIQQIRLCDVSVNGTDICC